MCALHCRTGWCRASGLEAYLNVMLDSQNNRFGHLPTFHFAHTSVATTSLPGVSERRLNPVVLNSFPRRSRLPPPTSRSRSVAPEQARLLRRGGRVDRANARGEFL